MKRLSNLWFVSIALVIATSTLGLSALAQEDITLNFTVWNYSLETIQDNIRIFEEQNPGIKVNLIDYAWPDYHDTIVLRFRSGTQTDIIYSGEDWLPEWASAGWLAPLEEIVPEVAQYKDKTASYAVNDMTFNGTLYGLSYYADLISFQFNANLLEENGIPVPQSWEDVRQAAESLQAAGIEKPFVYEYDQELPNFYSAFVAQVYGRGGQMFDGELNPVFNDPQSEAFKHLQWLQDMYADGLMALETHETKVVPAMNTGRHAFTVLFNYNLAALNNAATSALAGDFAMTPMPGDSHSTYGFAKFYAMTAEAAADPARREAAWKFIEFMGGGDYQVAKRWAIEKGLGFAQDPLFDDPDVQVAWSNWIDPADFKEQAQIAQNGTNTAFTGIWSAYFRPLLAKAIVGDASVQEVMDSGAEEWLSLRSQFLGY
ncbi:MAG: extracellular solute-binding protein [Trueperaceae bacterium]|nr:MAG: extracellular solute-binding protein [Trueperaceae bacterium]